MEKDNVALIVVDMQNDFIPGVSVAALPVTGGDLLIKPINKAMEDFSTIVVTQDWHPKGHWSFKSTGALGKWPDHCVQGSWGAQLEPFLKTDRVNLILRKGMNLRVDSYSAFRENTDQNGNRKDTGLTAWLKARGITSVLVCGLAKDYCVRFTCEDAVQAGFKTYLLDSLSKSVDPKNDDALIYGLQTDGVQIIW